MISNGLIQNHSLKELDLSGNNFDTKGGLHLIEGLYFNHEIQLLDIYGFYNLLNFQIIKWMTLFGDTLIF
jgi:hypothetical protein